MTIETIETSEPRDRVAIALDTADLGRAEALAEAVSAHVGVAKVGLQLFSAHGANAVAAMVDHGLDVMLDVKLHDIPNTVHHAAEVLGRLGASLVTMHAAGGADMLQAGIEGLRAGAAAEGFPAPRAVAVTVLTSQSATADVLGERVDVAVAAGCETIVCAATDLAITKGRHPHLVAITPGIRPAGVDAHDQNRIATPAAAIGAGADLLVIGRAITGADDPAAAARAIGDEIAAAIRSNLSE